MAVPTPFDWIANNGLYASAAGLQAGVGDPLNFLLSPPLCVLRQTTTQSIPTGAFTSLLFQTEDADTDNMHSTSTNTSRLTAVTAGWYQLSGQVGHGTASIMGRRGCLWAVNGTAKNGSQALTTAVGTGSGGTVQVATTMLVFLNVGDYVELQAYQDTGAALSTNVTTTAQSSVSALWVSR